MGLLFIGAPRSEIKNVSIAFLFLFVFVFYLHTLSTVSCSSIQSTEAKADTSVSAGAVTAPKFALE